jgi:hypothetical protein
MGWLSSLFRRQPSAMELLKASALAETERLRVVIERTPRASAETIEECARQLGTFQGVNHYYHHMSETISVPQP